MSDSLAGQRSSQARPGGRQPRLPGAGFTLVELLVVIGIIVILIGILIPTVSHVRKASQAASTQSLLVTLQGAIDQYYQDFRAYPGPISDNFIGQPIGRGTVVPLTSPNHVRLVKGRITGTENLVLGLMGGLNFEPLPTNPPGLSRAVFRLNLVGTGVRTMAYDFASSTATAKTNQIKAAYLSTTSDLTHFSPNNSSTDSGHYVDALGEANDSNIPEFLDRYSSPMPILYLRARTGAPNVFDNGSGAYTVITDATNARRIGAGPLGTLGAAQFDLNQIFGYVGAFTTANAWDTDAGLTPSALDARGRPTGGASIGEGKVADYYDGANVDPGWGSGSIAAKDLRQAKGLTPYHGLQRFHVPAGTAVGDADAAIPFSAPVYFRNPAFVAASGDLTPTDQPRARDAYILISAGPDRVYGTADDITSFGSVLP